jgi:hypothetical protein
MSFSGLSSPEDLKQAWKELIYDSDLDNDSADINVIWDYQSPEQLKPGLNIINCLYNPEAPDETGHYCLIFWNSSDIQEEVLFYNPVMSHTADDVCVKILEDLGNKFGIDNVKVDLSGSQHLDSSNCGYHCLTRAFQLYMMPGNRVIFGGEIGGKIKKGKTLEEMTTHELLESMVRLLRGIYFNSKNQTNKIQKDEKNETKIVRGTNEKGSGVADTLTDEEISKPMSYTELKKKFNDYISS